MDKRTSMLLANMISNDENGVKYIYATGNAYIDTGITEENLFRVVVKGKVRNTTLTNLSRFIGSIYMSSQGFFGSINTTDKQVKLSYRKTNSTIGTITSNYTLEEDFTLDGTFYSFNSYIGKNILLLACVEQSSSTSYYYSNNMIALSSAEFYDNNDNLMAKFIPTVINGENGMLETVSNTFKTNANSVGSLVCE